MTDTPEVCLSPERVACVLHLAPFRDQWPKGYAIFTIELWKSYAVMPHLLDVDPHKIAGGEALDSIPLCCQVEKKALLNAYIKSDVGVQKVCNLCSSSGLGTPLTVRLNGRKEKTLQHVCFHCVVYRVQTHPPT